MMNKPTRYLGIRLGIDSDRLSDYGCAVEKGAGLEHVQRDDSLEQREVFWYSTHILNL